MQEFHQTFEIGNGCPPRVTEACVGRDLHKWVKAQHSGKGPISNAQEVGGVDGVNSKSRRP